MLFTSLFSGCGGFDLGARAAGLEHCQAIEYDPQIAELFKANIGDCFVQDILTANPLKFHKPDWLHASPVCFPANTLILTKEGFKPIQDIEIGDFVVTHQARFKKVTNTLTREAKVLELKGQGHYGLITTPDHPFLSVEKKVIYPPHKERKAGNWSHSIVTEPQWVEASNLKGKHWLSLTQYPTMSIPGMEYLGNESLKGQTFMFSESFFKIVGLWVGNGWVRYSEGKCNKTNRGEVTISCNKNKAAAMRQDFINADIKFHETVKRTAINFSINSRPLCRWLVESFGKLAHGKKIPLWLLGASDGIRSSFFEGYMATDGCINKRNGVAIGLTSTTVSKELAFGMRMLGMTLGYSVTLKKHTPNPFGVIEGRTINQSPIYQLRYTKTEKMSFVSTIYRSGCIRNIQEIRDPQQVYCLTVEDDESFIADGIVVHNCKSYSQANANKGEQQLDIDCAIKTAKFIEVLEPPIFTLENVQAYEKSKAFRIILEKLYSLRYWVNYQVLNAADFSVPQSRRRLIIVALKRNLISDSDIIQSGDIRLVKNSLEKGSLINANQLALFDTPKSLVFEFDRIPDVNDESLKYLFKQGFYAAIVNNKFVVIKGNSVPPLPPKEKHIGWYEAIKDLVHDLPDSKLADWQIKALPREVRDHLLIDSTASENFGLTYRNQQLPSITITSDSALRAGNDGKSFKAILIENTGARSDRPLQTRQDDEPCWTIRAMGQDGHYHRANALLVHPTEQRSAKPYKYADEIRPNHGGENIKALLENAKIKALDIACLARLQSFPDDYKWSGKKSVDGKAIGNSVPPLMAQKIVRAVVNP